MFVIPGFNTQQWSVYQLLYKWFIFIWVCFCTCTSCNICGKICFKVCHWNCSKHPGHSFREILSSLCDGEVLIIIVLCTDGESEFVWMMAWYWCQSPTAYKKIIDDTNLYYSRWTGINMWDILHHHWHIQCKPLTQCLLIWKKKCLNAFIFRRQFCMWYLLYIQWIHTAVDRYQGTLENIG